MSQQERLSRRERQIMEVLYQRGKATASEVLQALAEPPSYSAVRALLRVLEHKGQVRHRQEGKCYVFRPTQTRDRARKAALRHLLRTYFDGSREKLLAALLRDGAPRLSRPELARLALQIAEAQRVCAG
jgi:predicted transcriptional regulator